MAAILKLRDGIEVVVNEAIYQMMPNKLQMGGFKMYKTPKTGNYIVLTPCNLLMIEHFDDEDDLKMKEALLRAQDEVDVPFEKKDVPRAAEKKAYSKEELAIIAQETKVPSPAEEAKNTDKAETAMEALLAKSNCKHGPELLNLYVQQTAKGVRYFPVCSFCGKRERYVSEKKIIEGLYPEGSPNAKWTAADVAVAKPWVEG